MEKISVIHVTIMNFIFTIEPFRTLQSEERFGSSQNELGGGRHGGGTGHAPRALTAAGGSSQTPSVSSKAREMEMVMGRAVARARLAVIL